MKIYATVKLHKLLVSLYIIVIIIMIASYIFKIIEGGNNEPF